MDGWTDGSIDRWTDPWIDGWMNGGNGRRWMGARACVWEVGVYIIM